MTAERHTLTASELHEVAVRAAEQALAAYVAHSGGHDAIGWTEQRFDEECGALTQAIAGELHAIHDVPMQTYAEQLVSEEPGTMTTEPDHAFWGITNHQARKPWVRRIARIFPIYIEHHLTDGSTVFERVNRPLPTAAAPARGHLVHDAIGAAVRGEPATYLPDASEHCPHNR